MARKRKASPEEPKKEVEQGRYFLPNDAPWGGFINLRVTDEQKDHFAIWFDANRSLIDSSLEDTLSEGMRFGLAYDAENECFIATFTGKGVASIGQRYCLTSRAGTIPESIALLLWKHWILCDGDWGDFNVRTGRMMSWG